MERVTGFEPATFSLGSGQHPTENASGAGDSRPSGNRPSTGPSSQAQNEPAMDAELAVVAAAWASLPAALRAGIVAMVRAAGA